MKIFPLLKHCYFTLNDDASAHHEFSSQAYAQDANILELQDAWKRALSSNPGLAEMQERYEALTYAPQVAFATGPGGQSNAMNFPIDSFDVNQNP